MLPEIIPAEFETIALNMVHMKEGWGIDLRLVKDRARGASEAWKTGEAAIMTAPSAAAAKTGKRQRTLRAHARTLW